MEAQILTTFRLSGEPVQNYDLFTRAWDECIELQTQPRETWIGRALLGLQGLDRYEIAVHEAGVPQGAVAIAHDPWDAHVGPCMSVFAQYVLPEYRNTGISRRLMRAAVNIARESGVSTLAFTHRKGPWRYETLYRRIKP